MPKLVWALKRMVVHHEKDQTYKATLNTYFIGNGIRLCQMWLKRFRIPFVTITGRRCDVKSSKHAQEKVDAYNSNKVRIMLFSSAGSHGMDLHGTTECFMVDYHWNTAKTKQAESRVVRYDSHKLSEKKQVTIYYLTTVPPSSIKTSRRTADEYLRDLCKLKDNAMKLLDETIREHCVETVTPGFLINHLPNFYNKT